MASGSPVVANSRVRPSRRSSNKKTTSSGPKEWKKTKVVGVGDIVQFHSNNQNMTGNVGVVLGYVDKHTFIVKTFGGGDSDYQPMFVGVGDRIPDQNYTDNAGNNVGHQHFYYSNWIMNIVHRKNPKPPKKRKPIQFHEVAAADLPAVLTGEQIIPDGHNVVLVPTAASTVAVPAVVPTVP